MMQHTRPRIAARSLARGLVALAAAAALALPLSASAANAVPDGSGPQQAIPLSGTVTGSLAPGQAAWYTYAHDAKLNDALTLKSTPAVTMTPSSAGDYTGGAYFNVEWAGVGTDPSFPGGAFAKDLPGYYRVAQSTQSGLEGGGTLPDGTQYWQQGKSPDSTAYQIEVVNQTGAPMRYALTLTRSNDAVSAKDDAVPAPTA
jgi:hypothetical protein